jgi:serine/threonine protein kinase
MNQKSPVGRHVVLYPDEIPADDARLEECLYKPYFCGLGCGTLQFMSPEHLQAKEVDERSYTFSFGAVLYGMVTGKRAFPGERESL